MRLKLTDLQKRYNRRTIFQQIGADVTGPGSLAIVGRNGSGKSTLAKIIAGVLSPTSGSVHLEVGGSEIKREVRHRSIGFVAPYLTLYDEFTAVENIVILESMRNGRAPAQADVEAWLEEMGLAARRHERVGTFSSGMKQRVKYATALIHRPALLILDEPTANLDEDGARFVEKVVQRQSGSGIVVVATNESHEAAWCRSRIELGTR
ncbi:MAG: ABC transporter ATP-binding protein [Bacteroidetes bacterium]|nr:ABC transporter ATP-binding protein [Bacteroidota bacterium]